MDNQVLPITEEELHAAERSLELTGWITDANAAVERCQELAEQLADAESDRRGFTAGRTAVVGAILRNELSGLQAALDRGERVVAAAADFRALIAADGASA